MDKTGRCQVKLTPLAFAELEKLYLALQVKLNRRLTMGDAVCYAVQLALQDNGHEITESREV